MRNIDMAILQFKENRQTPMIPKNTSKKTSNKCKTLTFRDSTLTLASVAGLEMNGNSEAAVA